MGNTVSKDSSEVVAKSNRRPVAPETLTTFISAYTYCESELSKAYAEINIVSL